MFKNNALLHYHLAVHSWEQHTFRVTLSIPAHDSNTLSLTLPAWIPGSYMIRDFARQIIRLQATDENGTVLLSHKQDKQTWEIATHGQPVQISYDVFAFDLSVRSAYINDEYAFCNGTSVFLQIKEATHLPCTLTINAPEDTAKSVHTSMAQIPDTAFTYNAGNYDELIDHPIFIGRCVTRDIVVNDVTFTLLFSGEPVLALDRIARDLVPVCEHHMQLFGDPQPIQHYLFMTLLSSSGFGGLEHRNSTALLFPRGDLPMPGEEGTTDSYINFLSLCSHELFHTWNVKRIKPALMVAPDLSKEAYTPQLWIYEGFTSFYDDLTLARSGVVSPQKYLDILSAHLTRVLQGAGRHKQSAAESSFDAWTRFYKQDANSPNHIVSYYTKGGIIAFGLDLLLRRKSDGRVSLDTLMQHLWNDYGKDESGTPDEVIESLCHRAFGIDVSDYLSAVVYGTEDVPLQEYLSDIGLALHFRCRQSSDDKGGHKPDSTGNRHQLGASVKSAAMGVTVLQVAEGLAAEQAGLQINDTIIAADGTVVDDKLLQRYLNASASASLSLTVARDGRLIHCDLPVLRAREDVGYFTIEDTQRFERWLGLI
ncbi:M61 family metallopeptidase [Alteromonas halophila]|uniref:Peptidase M61 n=1 Tax=Alteromonas halophila TaxID=516698 RepID=A0A918N023_9ALTE|nr:PDZ domain-containing protein [Alteromonas halophila]GGW88295.1 peptidase M61 [Alteromonas halophila]